MMQRETLLQRLWKALAGEQAAVRRCHDLLGQVRNLEAQLARLEKHAVVRFDFGPTHGDMLGLNITIHPACLRNVGCNFIPEGAVARNLSFDAQRIGDEAGRKIAASIEDFMAGRIQRTR